MRIALLVSVLVAGCGEAPARPRPLPWSEPAYFLDEPRTGGATTVDDTSPRGLGRVVGNLAPERWRDVLAGKGVFQRVWRAAPAPGPGAGLGPLYNAASCSDCHFLDGRGGPPSEVTPDVRLLARLAVGGAGDPIYGGQLSELAEDGLPSEGRLAVDYAPRPVLLPDGTAIATRRPVYRWDGAPWGAASPEVALSPRMPAALAGMGLLEAIAAEDVVAAEDPDDRDGDGISGRASWVPDAVTGRRVLGRFGWKASQPTVEQQIAAAFRDDMGLTSWVRPETACTPHQRACRDRDGAEEVSRRDLALVTGYVRLLAVPRRREPAAPEVRRGRALFLDIGCAGCHTPRHTTGEHPQLPELSRQTIYPYTDLLLHDLGDELADGVREHEAAGREWRTPPLWGLGLLRSIHGRLRLLHDGRARSVEEAVLWHGGEARAARQRYEALAEGERASVVRFVESL